MKLKKRRKSRKMYGTRTHGFAAKKHKGKGNVGGKGMSGTGKKAGQKKTFVLRFLYPYFGRAGKLHAKSKLKQINLNDIEMNLASMLKTGKAKKGKDGIEIKFENHKILGEGEVKEKLIITAESFSESAKMKIEKAGGKAIDIQIYEERVQPVAKPMKGAELKIKKKVAK